MQRARALLWEPRSTAGHTSWVVPTALGRPLSGRALTTARSSPMSRPEEASGQRRGLCRLLWAALHQFER